jgi:hypothetical protein
MTKPGGVEQVCPAVLELEGISDPWISRIGLISSGGRLAVPLAVADRLDGSLDATTGVLSKRYPGIAIAQQNWSRRLRARPNIPLLKASAVCIDSKQCIVDFPLTTIGCEGWLSSRCWRRGGLGSDQ